MYKAHDFVSSNEEKINKEVNEFIERFNANIQKTGYLQGRYDIKYCPEGVLEIVTFRIKNKLLAAGWIFSYSVDFYNNRFEFKVFLDKSDII